MSTDAAGPPRFRAVVVDDEPASREAVRTLLATIAAVELVGEASNGSEAVALVRRTRPDLLFLDVHMPDTDGFGVLEALGDDIPGAVVLVTAHGEYAQRAFEVHALDYVMKPFGRPRFVAAVERALQRLEADEALGMKETLRSLLQSLDADRAGDAASATPTVTAARRIGVRTGNRTVLVDVDDIDWIEADGELVRLHVGDRIHLLRGPLRDLEAMLGEGRFVRVHRSAIVNLGRVEVLHRERDGSGSVALRTGVRLRVARGRWEELLEALQLDWKS